ncbi:unnamed protein product [Protopolystoma xenopodis]|uniref:Uncharacterized protein n=1 Tax=Protopolystoma xenopodis TaxID=117903 RepID=A0A3S5CMI3_9PLAT|nr:unnamed protein product [Protopolystoma xenopodis]
MTKTSNGPNPDLASPKVDFRLYRNSIFTCTPSSLELLIFITSGFAVAFSSTDSSEPRTKNLTSNAMESIVKPKSGQTIDDGSGNKQVVNKVSCCFDNADSMRTANILRLAWLFSNFTFESKGIEVRLLNNCSATTTLELNLSLKLAYIIFSCRANSYDFSSQPTGQYNSSSDYNIIGTWYPRAVAGLVWNLKLHLLELLWLQGFSSLSLIRPRTDLIVSGEAQGHRWAAPALSPGSCLDPALCFISQFKLVFDSQLEVAGPSSRTGDSGISSGTSLCINLPINGSTYCRLLSLLSDYTRLLTSIFGSPDRMHISQPGYSSSAFLVPRPYLTNLCWSEVFYRHPAYKCIVLLFEPLKETTTSSVQFRATEFSSPSKLVNTMFSSNGLSNGATSEIEPPIDIISINNLWMTDRIISSCGFWLQPFEVALLPSRSTFEQMADSSFYEFPGLPSLNKAAIIWRFPQSRRPVRLRVGPVVVRKELYLNQDFEMKFPCRLQFWDPLCGRAGKFVTYASNFYLSDLRPTDVVFSSCQKDTKADKSVPCNDEDDFVTEDDAYRADADALHLARSIGCLPSSFEAVVKRALGSVACLSAPFPRTEPPTKIPSSSSAKVTPRPSKTCHPICSGSSDVKFMADRIDVLDEGAASGGENEAVAIEKPTKPGRLVAKGTGLLLDRIKGSLLAHSAVHSKDSAYRCQTRLKKEQISLVPVFSRRANFFGRANLADPDDDTEEAVLAEVWRILIDFRTIQNCQMNPVLGTFDYASKLGLK